MRWWVDKCDSVGDVNMTTQGASVAWQDALPARYFERASAYPVVFKRVGHAGAARQMT